MTEQEIKEWIGRPDEARPLRAAVVEAMSGIPVPDSDESEAAAHAQWNTVMGQPGDSIF